MGTFMANATNKRINKMFNYHSYTPRRHPTRPTQNARNAHCRLLLLANVSAAHQYTIPQSLDQSRERNRNKVTFMFQINEFK